MIPWKNFLYFLIILFPNLPSLNPSSIPHHVIFRRELPTRKYKFVASSTVIPSSTTQPITTPTAEEQEIIDLFSPYDKDEPNDPNDMRIDQKLAQVGDQLPPPLSFIFPATKQKNPKDPKPPEIEELFSRDDGDDGQNGTTGPKYDKFGRLINSTLAGSIKRQEKSLVKQVRNKTLLIMKSDIYKNLPENQNKNSSEIERIKNFTKSFVKASLMTDEHNYSTTVKSVETSTSAYKVDFYFRSTTTSKPRPTRKAVVIEEIGDLDDNSENLGTTKKQSANVVTKKIKKPLKIEDYIDEQEVTEVKKSQSSKKPIKISDDFDYDEVPSTKKTTRKPMKVYEDDEEEEIQIKPTKKTTKKPVAVDNDDDENEVKIIKKVVKKPVTVIDNELDGDLDTAQSNIKIGKNKPHFVKGDEDPVEENDGGSMDIKHSRKKINSYDHDDHDLRFEGFNYNY